MKNSKSGFKISLKSFIAEKMLFQYLKKKLVKNFLLPLLFGQISHEGKNVEKVES